MNPRPLLCQSPYLPIFTWLSSDRQAVQSKTIIQNDAVHIIAFIDH